MIFYDICSYFILVNLNHLISWAPPLWMLSFLFELYLDYTTYNNILYTFIVLLSISDLWISENVNNNIVCGVSMHRENQYWQQP